MCAIESGRDVQECGDSIVLTSKALRRLNAIYLILYFLVLGLGVLLIGVNNERKTALQKIEQLEHKVSGLELQLQRNVRPLPSDLMI